MQRIKKGDLVRVIYVPLTGSPEDMWIAESYMGQGEWTLVNSIIGERVRFNVSFLQKVHG